MCETVKSCVWIREVINDNKNHAVTSSSNNISQNEMINSPHWATVSLTNIHPVLRPRCWSCSTKPGCCTVFLVNKAVRRETARLGGSPTVFLKLFLSTCAINEGIIVEYWTFTDRKSSSHAVEMVENPPHTGSCRGSLTLPPTFTPTRDWSFLFVF